MFRKSNSAGKSQHPRRREVYFIEPLEPRTLLATVTINAAADIGPVQTNLLGVNFATWDGLIANNGNTSNSTLQTGTQQLVAASGINTFRIPGGGTTDFFHFTIPGGGAAVNGALSVAAMAMLVSSVNGVGMVTVNYGTGSPQEGAAMLAYLNGAANSTSLNNINLGTAPIFLATATSPEPQTSTSVTWTTYNYQTAGFWATLRSQTTAANPTNSDGLNFLRIGRAAPFGFHFFEIGNEIYGATAAAGAFSADAHGLASFPASSLPMPAGANPGVGDPTTYIAFAKLFQTLAMQIDPTISIGIGSQSISRNDYSNWINNIFIQSVAQGFQPNFISDHIYPQAPGAESDSTLLAVGTTPSGGVVNGITNQVNTYDLAQRAAVYRALATHYFPGSNLPGASNYIDLLATEFNSVYTTPGKQSVSIVNGLFIADSIGSMMNTESGGTTSSSGTNGYDGLWVWDLHNGAFGTDNDKATLYGWRTGTGTAPSFGSNFGDYGMLGSGNAGTGTGSGTNTKYPDYFAEQLGSKIVKAGGTVVSATSSSSLIDTFAVMEANGHLVLLVVNKTVAPGTPPNNLPDPAISETFTLNGFAPASQAVVYQYGVPEDDASDNSSSNFAAALSNPASPAITGNTFTVQVPDYTMMVFDLAPAPTIATPAAANPAAVTGTTTNLTVLGTENGSDTGLTYTWSATGPASVSYAPNGTNAAKNTTATFISAGTYNFTVTVRDSNNQTVTSSVGVIVNQTLKALAVTPNSASVPDGQSQPLSGAATDQFNNPMSAPITWTLDSGGAGSVDANSGSYTAPPAGPGSATIRATSGAVSGTASIAIIFTTVLGTAGDDNITLTRSGTSFQVYAGSPSALEYSVPYASLGALTVSTLGGDDTVTVDFTSAPPVPAAGLTIDAGADNDSIIILGTAADDSATVSASSLNFNGSLINYTNAESITISSGAGSDTLTQTAQPSASLAFTPAGSNSTLNINAGNFIIPASTSGLEPVAFATLSIAAAGSVIVAGPPDSASHDVLVLQNLINAGILDLGANDLILQGAGADGLNQITTQLASGFNAGDGYWDGPSGILSTTAASDSTFLTTLGVMQNPDGRSFDNQPSSIGDIFVKYTYYGDADLNGVPNGADYHQIDEGFGSHLTGWSNGDFNFDGTVDGSDFSLIDNAFNQLTATGASPLTEKATISSLDKAVQVEADAIVNPPTPRAFAITHDKQKSADGSRQASQTLGSVIFNDAPAIQPWSVDTSPDDATDSTGKRAKPGPTPIPFSRVACDAFSKRESLHSALSRARKSRSV